MTYFTPAMNDHTALIFKISQSKNYKKKILQPCPSANSYAHFSFTVAVR